MNYGLRIRSNRSTIKHNDVSMTSSSEVSAGKVAKVKRQSSYFRILRSWDAFLGEKKWHWALDVIVFYNCVKKYVYHIVWCNILLKG